jgi:hypothetical protein
MVDDEDSKLDRLDRRRRRGRLALPRSTECMRTSWSATSIGTASVEIPTLAAPLDVSNGEIGGVHSALMGLVTWTTKNSDGNAWANDVRGGEGPG